MSWESVTFRDKEGSLYEINNWNLEIALFPQHHKQQDGGSNEISGPGGMLADRGFEGASKCSDQQSQGP